MKALFIMAACIALTGCSADAKPVKAERFFVNQTEQEIAKWLDLSLLIEGFPTVRGDFKWALTHPELGFSDDGYREIWTGSIDVTNRTGEVQATYRAVCDMSVFMQGLVVSGSFCELTEVN